eukprot:4887193-Pleurochrysis_carterae.AAC.1
MNAAARFTTRTPHQSSITSIPASLHQATIRIVDHGRSNSLFEIVARSCRGDLPARAWLKIAGPQVKALRRHARPTAGCL